MKHKHYDCIVAWAEGKEIEVKWRADKWLYAEKPSWDIDYEYRIKKEPVIEVKYFRLAGDTAFGTLVYREFDPDLEKWHLKITYQDGIAIKAEVAE